MPTGDPGKPTLLAPQRITRDHNVAGFSCGNDSLDQYLQRRALKCDAAGDAKVIVLPTENLEVLGYYTISAASVTHEKAVSKLKRNSPDPIPMALIGRFAIQTEMQGQGIGRALMRDAILRISQASDMIGIKGVLLHAINDDAKNFYTHLGFSESTIEDSLMMVRLVDIAYELEKGSAA